jgi:signal transduction histidine kinase
MHGGAVDLESRPGEGTTVTVTLPLQAQIADADREASHQR